MLTPGELARILDVDPKTVSGWNAAGTLDAIVTPGGHTRFPLATVLAFLQRMGFDNDGAEAVVHAVR